MTDLHVAYAKIWSVPVVSLVYTLMCTHSFAWRDWIPWTAALHKSDFAFVWFQIFKCCLMPSMWPRLANVVLSLGILNLTWPVGFNSFDVRHFFLCCCITSENIYFGEFKRHYRWAVHIYLQASSLLCSVIAYALHFVTLYVASQFQRFHLIFLLLLVFRTFFPSSFSVRLIQHPTASRPLMLNQYICFYCIFSNNRTVGTHNTFRWVGT